MNLQMTFDVKIQQNAHKTFPNIELDFILCKFE